MSRSRSPRGVRAKEVTMRVHEREDSWRRLHARIDAQEAELQRLLLTAMRTWLRSAAQQYDAARQAGGHLLVRRFVRDLYAARWVLWFRPDLPGRVRGGRIRRKFRREVLSLYGVAMERLLTGGDPDEMIHHAARAVSGVRS